MADYREQFPDFDPATMPAIPAGWVDQSWRNDACPCFAVGAVLVWVDYADPAERENGGVRFTISNNPDAPGAADHNETLMDGDDWAAVLAYVAHHAASPERAALAAEYVNLIGYDPFADDPSLTVEDVRQTLAEYKVEAGL